MSQKKRVHDAEPQWRDQRDQEHAEVPVGKRGQALEVSEGLVPAPGIGVVVGVTLQVVKRPVGAHVIAVPRVVRLAALVEPIGPLLAEKPVVLDVVCHRQVKCADEVSRDQVGNHDETKRDQETERHRDRDEPGSKDFVFE